MPNNIINNGTEILENIESWESRYRSGWLAEYQKTGNIDWKKYNPPKNGSQISGKGINLENSKLMLISSAGAYLKTKQEPFDAFNPLGDYSVRKILSTVKFEELAYAHDHYDHTAVNADPQVLLPLIHLRKMAADKTIGELSPIVSFMGYQPNAAQVIEVTIPAILKIAQEENVRGALLVPA
jgi:D-proline reductase (dithiol) PrdB